MADTGLGYGIFVLKIIRVHMSKRREVSFHSRNISQVPGPILLYALYTSFPILTRLLWGQWYYLYVADEETEAQRA